jgi:MFS family permease
MANIPLRSLLTPTIVIPIMNYTIMVLLDSSFKALFLLFLSTPIYLGGLGFTPSSIGSWLAFSGLVNGVFQALLFAKFVDWLGPKRLFCVSVSCFAPIIIMFPIMSWLARAGHAIVFALVGQLILVLTWDMTTGAC